ncbi:MAG: type II secretion system protein GspE, partial [Lachnospiraceae bacterium]|nr:type II secretion system protein GspE [Lachnospiraceae bacterium]
MALIRKKLRLGDVLINEGAITEEQLQKGLELQKQTKQRLGMTLVDAGITTEDAIAKALSHQLGYDRIKLRDVAIEQSVLDLIHVDILKKHVMIPIGYSAEEANVLRVAMADPMDMGAMDDINIITNLQVEPVVATQQSIMMAIDKYYGQKDVISK